MGKQLQKMWDIISSMETIWSLFQHLGLPKIITGMAGGAGMSIWSASQHIPPPYIVIVALLVFTLIIWAWNGITWRRGKQVKKIEKPESLIFPYIWRIDASQLQQGKNYLSLNYCLPNALSSDLTFIKARCYLVINSNNTTEEKEMRPIVIEKQKFNECYIEINLGEKISQQTRDNFKNRVAMRFKLYIFCWDNENIEHPLMTQDYETIALV